MATPTAIHSNQVVWEFIAATFLQRSQRAGGGTIKGQGLLNVVWQDNWDEVQNPSFAASSFLGVLRVGVTM